MNFYGPIRCSKAVMPYMRKQKSGHIINVSSVGGIVGSPVNEIYCAAKFALEGLNRKPCKLPGTLFWDQCITN